VLTVRNDPATVAQLRAFDSDWIGLASALGYTVTRADASYVWYDGRGAIGIATDGELDHDDTLAQIILHEVCHAVTEGESSGTRPDWGLDNTTDSDVPHEWAALRLQAAVLDVHGLRGVLVPTTSFRDYYLGLPAEPIPASLDASDALARQAWQRWCTSPARPLVDAALRRVASSLRG
jgi:hypothetical protein